MLVGGSGMTTAVWDLSIKPHLLQAGHRVITFDSRGTGESGTPAPPYSIADMAADTIGLIEHVVDGPCHLVGLSLGGFVAEQVCWQRPDLVSAAALIACAGPTTAFMRAKMRAEAELFAAGPVPVAYDHIDALTVFLPPRVLQDDDSTVEQWAELLTAMPQPSDQAGRLGQTTAAHGWLLDDTRTQRWPQMQVPALLIAFEHDIQFPPSRARQAAAAWPQASFTEIPGVAHGNGAATAAPAIAQAINEFLLSHPGQ